MQELSPIRTSNLVLRRFSTIHAAKVLAMSREPGIMEWLPDQVYKDEQNASDVLKYLRDKFDDPGNPALAAFVLAICLKDTAEVIGHVGLSPYCGDVEIGYAIEEKFQGKGYASEAVSAMAEYGLNTFGLKKILGIVHKENSASCRVLEKAGFILINEEAGQLHGRPGVIRRYEKKIQ